MVDAMVFAAHPDDGEISMGGTILKLKAMNYGVGICDLTSGESGTYGSAEIRAKELQAASSVLSLDVRQTLDIPDGHIQNNEENRKKIITIIRTYKPAVVFSFTETVKRHPDHFYCGELVRQCVFLSGLEKLMPEIPAHRPRAFIGFSELLWHQIPSFVVDVTPHWEKKIEAIACYHSQFDKKDPQLQAKTFWRSENFWDLLQARARIAGAQIGVKYGEPFFTDLPPHIDDPLSAYGRRF